MCKKFNYEEAVDAGRRIRAAYLQKGWALSRLAAEMGYSLDMVQKVVSGGYSISRRFAKRLDAVLPGWRDVPLVDEVEKYKIVDGETVRAGIDDLIKRFEFRIVRLAGGDATNAVVAQVTETLLNLHSLRKRYGAAEAAPVEASASSTFTDPRDGQVYRTVNIGGRVWMAENLNYAAEGSACYGKGGKTGLNGVPNATPYGRLYDWEAAKAACPPGWRLPSDVEWMALEAGAGGRDTAGKRLKAKFGWNGGSRGRDRYGFSASPGGRGYRTNRDEVYFDDVGCEGVWWSATEYDNDSVWCRSMFWEGDCVYRNFLNKLYMFSVRCVRNDAGA
jgi:uncharacterized protein (TIGR02145 family)